MSEIIPNKMTNIETNQEAEIETKEPESETKTSGWADFIRRELKYSDQTNNYHQVLMLAVIADKLEKVVKCLEGRNF